MGKPCLLDVEIRTGRRLGGLLLDNDIPLDFILWLYKPEEECWHFVIITPLVDKVGSLRAYGSVCNCFTRVCPGTLIGRDCIEVLRSDSELAKGLKSMPRLGDEHIINGYVGTVFVEEAFIYLIGWRENE